MELEMKFQPGQSGNPAGRPPGSRNKKTLALEEEFEEHVDEILKEVVGRAKEGEKAAMRLCMERMLAPKRERPVAIDLPAIETPADARKAIAVVFAVLAAGGLTITEATRLIGLIQRVLRLVGQIEKMESADREERQAETAAPPLEPSTTMGDGESAAPPDAAQTRAPADPALYFPVNSETAGPRGGREGAEPSPQPSAGSPLLRAA
jgi:Family of unknown function (DUF5681)